MRALGVPDLQHRHAFRWTRAEGRRQWDGLCGSDVTTAIPERKSVGMTYLPAPGHDGTWQESSVFNQAGSPSRKATFHSSWNPSFFRNLKAHYRAEKIQPLVHILSHAPSLSWTGILASPITQTYAPLQISWLHFLHYSHCPCKFCTSSLLIQAYLPTNYTWRRLQTISSSRSFLSLPPQCWPVTPSTYVPPLTSQPTKLPLQYGLDDPGVNPSWSKRFFFTQPPIQWEPGICSGVKRPMHEVHRSNPSAAYAKISSVTHLHPYMPSWRGNGKRYVFMYLFKCVRSLTTMFQTHKLYYRRMM
jgi:hypothetical protein